MVNGFPTVEAYTLLHDGAIALAQVESNGIRVDMPYLDGAEQRIAEEIKALEIEIDQEPLVKKWRARFGPKMGFGKRRQLAAVLQSEGIDLPETQGGSLRTDRQTVDDLNLPFLKKWRRILSWKKIASTYIRRYRKEAVQHFDGNWYIHPFFPLNRVISYRSSSANPNFQNNPNRDKEQAKVARRSFISRDGFQLAEFDFKGSEVCVAACVTKDPSLIKYVTDPATDMHRDVAMQLFKLKKTEVTKAIRQVAKTWFTFAEFYGDFYIHTAANLWNSAKRENLELADGTKLIDHLGQVGIDFLGGCISDQEPLERSFEGHVKRIEQDFWGRRFRVYADWKRSWYEAYQRSGYFDLVTGFRCEGLFDRKQAVNYPVQGPSFHCLLWVLIRLQKWLNKHGMRSLILGQIHDSIVMDIWIPELETVKAKIKRLVTEVLPKRWPWVIVPMVVEAEVSGPGESWFDKKEVEL